MTNQDGVALKGLRLKSRVVVAGVYCCITKLSRLSEGKRPPFHMFGEAGGQKFRQVTAGAACLCLSWEDLNSGRLGSSGSFFTTRLAPGLGMMCRLGSAETVNRWLTRNLSRWPGLFTAQRLNFKKQHPQRERLESKCPKIPRRKLFLT